MSSIDSVIGDCESLRVVVYEHVSSGGFAGEPLPAGILSEGFAMLRTVTSDFQAAGHSVTVLLDSRLAAFNPPLDADQIVQVSSSKEAEEALDTASERADAALVIAPESNQVLQSLVELVETTDLKSLNCSASGITKAANKANLYAHMKSIGVTVPETLLFTDVDGVEKIAEDIQQKTRFPVVFKPLNGTSCAGLSLVSSPNQIAAAIDKIQESSTNDQFIVQQFIEGVAASVSLISTGHKALPVSLNKQDVTLGAPEADSSYNGGKAPLDSSLTEVAFAAAKQVVESFGGLRGYVGVDLVLTEDTAFVVDVNPRLTTSYVGLRSVACFNPVEAMLNAVVKDELPKKVQMSGYSCFSKVVVPKPDVFVLPEIYKVPSIVSPPFPFDETETSCALVETHGVTLQDAQFKFREAKKHLQSICHGGT